MKKSLFVLSSVAGIAALLGAGIAQAQDVYVTDQTSDQLTVIGPGGTLNNIVNPPSQTFLDDPTGIAVDTVAGSQYYGDVFVANYANGTIVTYNPNAPAATAFGTFATGLTNPEGLAFDGSGNLYVANATSTGVITQYSGINLTTTTSSYATGVPFAFGVAATFSGQLYVTSASTGLVQQVASGGGTAGTFTPTSTPNGAEGVVIGPNGDLYVVNNGTPNVEQIKVGGNSSVAVTNTGELHSPAGLAFDADGNLYVADYGSNTVTEYDLTNFNMLGQTTYTLEQTFGLGTGTTFFNGPTFLAFDPVSQTVPEPGTYAMLFGGLAMLYVMQRRRSAVLAKA